MGEEDKSVSQKDQPYELMLRYLSGELSDDLQSRIEEKFFADEEYFEQLLAAEGALIDDFVQGKLSSAEREEFDRFVRSSPYEAREIEFVRELIRDVSEAGLPKPDQSLVCADRSTSRFHSILGLFKAVFRPRQLAFAALVAGTLSLPLVLWNLSLQRKIRGIEAERVALEQREQQLEQQLIQRNEINLSLAERVENERNLRGQIEKELDDLTQSIPRLARAAVVSVLLTTEAITRGTAHAPTVHLQPETHQLRIEIDLERSDNFKKYSAVVKTFDGRRIWGTDQIRRDQSSAHRRVLVLPARIFASDDFILTLSGQNDGESLIDLRDYSFRVRR